MRTGTAAATVLRDAAIKAAAIGAAALLFAGAFPNPLFANGLPLLAFVAYAPVFWVIRRSGFRACAAWGALYGYAAYGLFNYWLSVFHPLAGLIVGALYLVYMACLFPLLRLAVVLYPRRGWLLQWAIWIAYEYLRTQGFLGYSYGITGYSQWRLLPLIQIASVTGVWGVSALVVFPSVWLAEAGRGTLRVGGAAPHTPCREGAALPDPPLWALKKAHNGGSGRPWPPSGGGGGGAPAPQGLTTRLLPIILWAVVMAGVLVWGAAPRDFSGGAMARVALVQHNTDPWRGGIAEYRSNYRVLRRLSDEAIAAHPDLDLVVWSETAFVPRIYWHQTVRDDPESWALVRELLAYLAGQDAPFVIGNDDARKEPSRNPVGDNRVDYNAVMLFDRGEIVESYRKLRLVPFTESFPYKKQFPWIYDALINADTHFWEPGEAVTVFDSRGLRFSTPICFEDTFGDLSRAFTRAGAELIVNLSNDAWSHSLPAQMQHLSMAVFRAVENRRAMARSTASGQTCAVDPAGRVLAMAEPFTEAWLYAELPVMTGITLYTRFGDWLPRLFAAASLVLLILGIGRAIVRRTKA